MAYTAITIEGGLFPADLLDRIATGDAEGQRGQDFGLPKGERLSDEIQGAFSDVRSYWDAFQRRLQHSGTSRTTLTREAWVIPFLERLDYRLVYQPSAAIVGGQTYAISHRTGDGEAAPPVHVVACDQRLDERRQGQRCNPYALVQEYLNRSDPLWGIVTNGEQLRLLRDSARVSRPTYLEFDLRGMVDGNLYSEFVLLYRLLHRTRLPESGQNPQACLLEKYYQAGIEEGGRVREHLRDGVEESLRVLGTAFLQHPQSEDLRRAVRTGQLGEMDYYRQLLRLVYRLLFLLVVEERRILVTGDAAYAERQQIYSQYYGLSSLRDRCDRPFADDHYADIWQRLLKTFLLFREQELAEKLGLSALDGELFGASACVDLEAAYCENSSLLQALFCLTTFQDRRIRRRVNFAGLDVEELGSIYESLLDFHPRIRYESESQSTGTSPLAGNRVTGRSPDGRTTKAVGAPEAADTSMSSEVPSGLATFDLVIGSERKQTGSYYTPPQLVHELIQSALVPLIEDRLNKVKTDREKEAALLDLRVCDPASGSGHFLLAAARRIARELATIRSAGEEPTPQTYRVALREVIRSCIYAVDKNPLAVDLCKVALWIESYNAGMPLSFLDNHIKCGDALVGVFDLDVLVEGIPDEAYYPVSGDDKGFAAGIRKQNKKERGGEVGLIGGPEILEPKELAPAFREVGVHEERTPYDVREKERAYERLRGRGTEWWGEKVACDLWTAAFFVPLKQRRYEGQDAVPTTDTIRRYLQQPGTVDAQLIGEAQGLSQTHPFFHWPLEFPDVFARGGFDVVLGNPPWEQLQPEEIKFFAALGRRDIALLPGARRKAVIERLAEERPDLALAWRMHQTEIEKEGAFIRGAGRFDLTAVGKLNTYSLFAELNRKLLNGRGLAGCIVPSGIATDDTTKGFFRDLMEKRSLTSLYDFENRENIFPGVGHGRFRFCLLTMSGSLAPGDRAGFAFLLTNTDQLRDSERRFALSAEDMSLLNPNTHTCPIFRSRRDAELTKAIYLRVPVLIEEGPPEVNLWAVSFRQGLFNMTSDSHLFRTRAELRGAGWELAGNVFVHEDERYLPLYEAKFLWHFDHRLGTYRGFSTRPENTHLPPVTPAEHNDPTFLTEPWYWVPDVEVAQRLNARWSKGWLLGWRDICRSTDERTVIASLLPRVGVGHTVPLFMPQDLAANSAACVMAGFASFCFDFVARQKIAGTHLTYSYLNQLPVLPPSTYDQPALWSPDETLAGWIAPRVLELAYTAWDMEPFARDMGYTGPPFGWDEERRFFLRCELDAAFFHLYGIERDDVAYIMETFPIVKRKDEATYGEYRTKRAILESYDMMAEAAKTGAPHGRGTWVQSVVGASGAGM